ncbi:MAG TPA: tetratricopeptide repeat protein, partial [Kribbellaceae bacterium]|nr:tetratricopeptide repeat protein [Kribbellaceae bacterium]
MGPVRRGVSRAAGAPPPLLGRAAELDALTHALASPEARLITLTGPPGVGKSRLAAAVAERAADRFPDGTMGVDLGVAGTGDAALAEIARAFGTDRSAATTEIDRVSAYLRDRGVLLVLDSCEAVSALDTTLTDLVRRCPRLKVLATSRERLRLSIERAVAVPPLAMPALTALDDLDTLAAVPSVALLLDRTRLVRPGFQLTPANAEPVARICLQLEGLPLAIEVAAARLHELEPADLAARLHGRGLLIDTRRRSGSLRAAIGWSHQTLTEHERTLFRRLAVFPAEWSLPAAENVAGEPGLDVLGTTAALVDKSLVRAALRADGSEGFTMLDVIREYTAEELDRSGERPLLERRHRDYYAALAAEAETAVATIHEGTWMEWYGLEHANLRTALECSLATGDVASGLPLATATGWYWYSRGQLQERGNEVDEVIEAAERAGARTSAPDALAAALLAAGVVAYARHDQVHAGVLLRDALALCDERTDRPVSPRCAAVHAFLGHLARDQGRLDSALREHTTSYELFRAQDNARGTAWARHDLGLVALERGELAEAEKNFTDALEWFETSGDAWACAWVRAGLAEVCLRREQRARAAELLTAALAIYEAYADLPRIGYCLERLAAVASAAGGHERALKLLAAGVAIRTPADLPTKLQLSRDAAVQASAEDALGARAA